MRLLFDMQIGRLARSACLEHQHLRSSPHNASMQYHTVYVASLCSVFSITSCHSSASLVSIFCCMGYGQKLPRAKTRDIGIRIHRCFAFNCLLAVIYFLVQGVHSFWSRSAYCFADDVQKYSGAVGHSSPAAIKPQTSLYS